MFTSVAGLKERNRSVQLRTENKKEEERSHESVKRRQRMQLNGSDELRGNKHRNPSQKMNQSISKSPQSSNRVTLCTDVIFMFSGFCLFVFCFRLKSFQETTSDYSAQPVLDSGCNGCSRMLTGGHYKQDQLELSYWEFKRCVCPEARESD